MILGSKPRNSEFVHWNSLLVSVKRSPKAGNFKPFPEMNY